MSSLLLGNVFEVDLFGENPEMRAWQERVKNNPRVPGNQQAHFKQTQWANGFGPNGEFRYTPQPIKTALLDPAGEPRDDGNARTPGMFNYMPPNCRSKSPFKPHVTSEEVTETPTPTPMKFGR